ncbi:hypothetical protein PIB30_039090 [Stylosanthes scabra]|uniref:Uncharacterized protein n=1 Tax=Stylosanthes scabra TaxID=79078 RepID=A0ABU6YEH0_9FABA|nr:hypothetical protein [Stylosanthes scabra]
MIANPNTIQDQAWYADSGASHHCTPVVSNLQQSSDYQGQEQDTHKVILKGLALKGMYRFERVDIPKNNSVINSPTVFTT